MGQSGFRAQRFNLEKKFGTALEVEAVRGTGLEVKKGCGTELEIEIGCGTGLEIEAGCEIQTLNISYNAVLKTFD